MKTDQLRKIVLLAAAFLFAGGGQFYFAHKSDYFSDALVFYGLGIAFFLLAVRVPAQPSAASRPATRLTPGLVLRSVPIAAGLLLGLLAVLQLLDPHDNYWPIFWTWISAAALYLLGFARRPVWSWRRAPSGGAGQGVRQAGVGALGILSPWMRGRAPAAAGAPALPAALATEPLAEWGLVALLVGGALVLRVWHIDTIPWTLGGDEGNFGLFARAVLNGEVRNMFVTGHLSMPTMYSFFQAAWFRLAGDNTTGLRLPWAVLGTSSVLGAYLLVRRLFGRNLALLTAFLLATYHFHIHYSRLGINNISDPLFISWSLYFLVLGWQGKRGWAWAASGMLAGLAFYSYTGSRLVPIALAAALAWAALLDRDFVPQNRYDLLAMLGGFLVIVGPMALFAFQHPDDFNARVNQIGILQSGWLAQAAQTTGQSQARLLFEQLRRAFLAFNFYRDRMDFYRPSIPLLDFIASVLFVFGLAYAAARLRPRRGEG
ncbi:MAG TPA: glycosyltransferase family 39 protein, partial [Anaerolineae bacterium]